MDQSCTQLGVLGPVLLFVIGHNTVHGQQVTAEDASGDNAIATIASLANWPNSDDHWSDIPGWPVDKWGKWGDKADDEEAQPTKRKVDQPNLPISANPTVSAPAGFFGFNQQQMYQNTPFPGHNAQQPSSHGHPTNHQDHVPSKRQNPYSNYQTTDIPSQDMNYQRAHSGGFFQENNNIPQYPSSLQVEAKGLPGKNQNDFSIKSPKFSSNGFFGQNEAITQGPIPVKNYQKITYPNYRQPITQKPYHGRNTDQQIYPIPNEIQQNQKNYPFSNPNPFKDNSNVQFTNPFKSFKNNAVQENGLNQDSHLVDFKRPRRNFPINNRSHNKPRSNFGFQAPPTNILGNNRNKGPQQNFKPQNPFTRIRGPAFNPVLREEHNLKRKIPNRFQPLRIQAPPSPIVGNPFNSGDFPDFENTKKNEFEDKEFMKDFENTGPGEVNIDGEYNGNDYADEFFNDPDGENFDFSDFDQFDSYDYEKEKVEENDNKKIVDPKEKTRVSKAKYNSPQYHPHSSQSNVENIKELNVENTFSRQHLAKEAVKRDGQKQTKNKQEPEKFRQKDKKLDFNYSTEGLEMFKKSKHRKPTYKDPYRKPDGKFIPSKPANADPNKEFEPLFDYGEPLSGFGPEFTGAEFDFGPEDETAEQSRTSNKENDSQQEYDNNEEYNEYYEEKEEKEEEGKNERDNYADYKSESFETGSIREWDHDIDQDKEYLDKVFSEFKDKYANEEKNAQNRRISHKSMDDKNNKKSDDMPYIITDPFEQGEIDKYDYVHEKLMTDDHWEAKNIIPESRINKDKYNGNSQQDPEFDNFLFSNKKGIQLLEEIVDSHKIPADGGPWIPMTKAALGKS